MKLIKTTLILIALIAGVTISGFAWAGHNHYNNSYQYNNYSNQGHHSHQRNHHYNNGYRYNNHQYRNNNDGYYSQNYHHNYNNYPYGNYSSYSNYYSQNNYHPTRGLGYYFNRQGYGHWHDNNWCAVNHSQDYYVNYYSDYPYQDGYQYGDGDFGIWFNIH